MCGFHLQSVIPSRTSFKMATVHLVNNLFTGFPFFVIIYVYLWGILTCVWLSFLLTRPMVRFCPDDLESWLTGEQYELLSVAVDVGTTLTIGNIYFAWLNCIIGVSMFLPVKTILKLKLNTFSYTCTQHALTTLRGRQEMIIYWKKQK